MLETIRTSRRSSLTFAAQRMPTELPVWTRRQLNAAYWVGRVLAPKGTARQSAHDSYPTLPLGGRVDVAELRAAEVTLIEAGLVDDNDDRLLPDDRLVAACQVGEEEGRELVLSLLLESAPPLWLLTAGGDGRQLRSELIPDAVEEALATTITDPGRREAFLLARARTVDVESRRLIGQLGEVAVVEACIAELVTAGSSDLAQEVSRVSLISDELGYDVTAPRLDHTTRRLEVKTTRSTSATVRVFLTRTEATVGAYDSGWALVLVRLAPNDTAAIVGWTEGPQLGSVLPVDEGNGSRWETASVRLDESMLHPGLPPAGLPG
jgi:hypothetical protein